MKIVLSAPEWVLDAFNDIITLENLSYSVKYDTVYGRY